MCDACLRWGDEQCPCVCQRQGGGPQVCPIESSEVLLSVSGNGSFKAAANGDPTCLDVFNSGKMHLFGGSLTAIVQSGETPGTIKLEASAKGLKKASIVLCSLAFQSKLIS